ncbi:acyl-CoA synthetase [Sphingobium sp. Sx8-8]|uniref:acyl-CoA synthetase n=1 Tax=Sphingobium sp. Sx8-8 TaxID=2933617 RepID=UPI001F55DA3D|nr:acyl-CoA synthetase [Sphingobium sp. Sx8-8]
MHPRHHALSTPDKPACIMAETGETLSYAELEKRANQGAHFLRSLGITAGDTVAIWLPNTLRYYEVYWAAQRAGLYITPISAKLTGEEAAYILGDCKARLLVTSGEMEALPGLLKIAAARCPALDHILWADGPMDGKEEWAQAIATFPETPIADESAGFHMVYSSGTTGRPKGVRLPLSGGPATEPHMLAERLSNRYGIGEDTVYLSPAPIYHTAPLAYSTMAQRLGATVVLLRRFVPETALEAIQRYRVTFSQMVPTMFLRMLRLPEEQRLSYDLSSLRGIVHAAAPCPVEVKRAMIEWVGPIIHEYYGGSEGNGTTYISAEEWLRKPGSVGRSDFGTLHICDEAGHELPSGEQGLVYFEGGWDFSYLNDAQKTNDARNPLHPTWTTLGDIGYADADGYLFLTDRKSFMIISGGVNIYPQEIENLLIVHPKIADVAVIGVPSAEMGEEVKAVVQPRDWQDAGPALEAELIAYCRSHLSSVKCPRSVDFERELPRHETGKLYKREIRDRYWKDRDGRIA